MIIDILENARFYYNLDPRIKRGLEIIQETDFSALEVGRHSVPGTDVHFYVQEFDTIPMDNNRWEAHRRHADIQYVISGNEDFGYRNVKGLVTTVPYNEAEDIEFFNGTGDFVRLVPGMFAIQFLHDAHLADSHLVVPSHVRKVVVKMPWK